MLGSAQHYNGPITGVASGQTTTATPLKQQELDRIADRLNGVGAALYGVDQRLLAVADRLFGSAPTGTGSDKTAGLPVAAIGALDAYISNINDALERICGHVSRIEHA